MRNGLACRRWYLTAWDVDRDDTLGVFDHLLAPMYIRVLFGAGPLSPDYVDGLVDRLL